MKLQLVALTTVVLGSCGIPRPEMNPSALSPVLPKESPFSLKIDSSVTGADSATVSEIVGATMEVVRSSRFITELSNLNMSKLWLSPTGGTLRPRDVAQIYAGGHSTIRPVPTVLFVNSTSTPVADFNEGSPATATITLPPFVLERWRSGTAEGRSCAVNSLAHEMAHTFSSSSRVGVLVFADGARALATFLRRPLVSYTVGTVAQCTMMQNQREDDDDFAACVKTWGTNTFNSGGCD